MYPLFSGMLACLNAEWNSAKSLPSCMSPAPLLPHYMVQEANHLSSVIDSELIQTSDKHMISEMPL